MNAEKRLTALEESMLKQMNTEALGNWIGSMAPEEQAQALSRITNEQLEALHEMMLVREGTDAIDLAKFSDEELETIAAGQWSYEQIQSRAKEIGAL